MDDESVNDDRDELRSGWGGERWYCIIYVSIWDICRTQNEAPGRRPFKNRPSPKVFIQSLAFQRNLWVSLVWVIFTLFVNYPMCAIAPYLYFSRGSLEGREIPLSTWPKVQFQPYKRNGEFSHFRPQIWQTCKGNTIIPNCQFVDGMTSITYPRKFPQAPPENFVAVWILAKMWPNFWGRCSAPPLRGDHVATPPEYGPLSVQAFKIWMVKFWRLVNCPEFF